MSKHFIFNSNNGFLCIAATDALKDTIVAKEGDGAKSVVATDDQWNKVRRGLATVEYDGSNLNYSVLLDEDFLNPINRSDVGNIIESLITRVESFNLNNQTAVSIAYEDKLKELLVKFKNHNEAREADFPNLTTFKTFEDWYLSQPGFPDFSNLEIY